MIDNELISLKRRMQAVKVQNFYGLIISEALAVIDDLQDRNIALQKEKCSRRSTLHAVAGQILSAGHMNAEDMARLRAALEGT